MNRSFFSVERVLLVENRVVAGKPFTEKIA